MTNRMRARQRPRHNAHMLLRSLDTDTIALTLGVSLVVALAVVGLRVWLLQRARRTWQMDGRKQTERLSALLAAYRSLGGSFTPPTGADARQIEEALADLMVFGSETQVRLAATAVAQLAGGQVPHCQPLVEDLRTELRSLLGLVPLPAGLDLPPSGPGRGGVGGGRAARRAGSPPALADSRVDGTG